MGSFSTSLSGLNAEEQALSVISNDLANLKHHRLQDRRAGFQRPVLSDVGHGRGRRPGATGGWRHDEHRLIADDPRECDHHGSAHGRCHPGKRAVHLESKRDAGLFPRRNFSFNDSGIW